MFPDWERLRNRLMWILKHWKMALAGALLVVSFAGGWYVNGWRWEARFADYSADVAADANARVEAVRQRQAQAYAAEIADLEAQRRAAEKARLEAAETAQRARQEAEQVRRDLEALYEHDSESRDWARQPIPRPVRCRLWTDADGCGARDSGGQGD